LDRAAAGTFDQGGVMNRPTLFVVMAALGLCALAAGCATANVNVPSRVPFIGRTPDLEVHAVKSIKTVRVARIAVMPLVEAPSKSNGTVIEGSGETVTAELIGQVALAG